jgi:glycosyltransferase involved in cell wall biosynthesis
MNRAHQLKETLPANIQANAAYPNLEFIVLDYNSKDGLGDWVKENQSQLLYSGAIKYYKTNTPEVFHLSHSKNMAIRLATGNIICCVDADNFTGKGYAAWVNEVFSDKGKKSIITTIRKSAFPLPNQGGKISFAREAVYAARGFDEQMVDYGMEDVDLVNRLELKGGSRVYIEADPFLTCLTHSDQERLENFSLLKRVQKIFINSDIANNLYADREVIYLFDDNQFYKIIYQFHKELKEDRVLSLDGWLIRNNGFQTGNFSVTDGLLELLSGSPQANEQYLIKGNTIVRQDDPGKSFFMVTKDMKYFPQSDNLFMDLILAISECLNRARYKANETNLDLINNQGWGKGQVFFNFDHHNPIDLD